MGGGWFWPPSQPGLAFADHDRAGADCPSDGNPLAITHTTGTAISQPFTVTPGASVLVVILEDKGANLPEPATLAWNSQTLVRDVQTSFTVSPVRSLAIYHLFNPQPGTNDNITGTLGAGVSNQWVSVYTLNGVDTGAAPVVGSVNTGDVTTGVIGLSISVEGVVSNSWAVVSSEFANFGAVNFTGTGGVGTVVSDVNDAATTATAGYVSGLSAGRWFFRRICPQPGKWARKNPILPWPFSPRRPLTRSAWSKRLGLNSWAIRPIPSPPRRAYFRSGVGTTSPMAALLPAPFIPATARWRPR